MTQDRRDRLDDDLARCWLETKAPKQAPEPKPKPQRRERWQMLRRERQKELRALAKPLLKGVI